MGTELITTLLFTYLVIGLISGLPLSFTLGSAAVFFAYFLWGPDSLFLIAQKAYSTQTTFTLTCLPMFIFIGLILEKSGIAEKLFDAMTKWFGWLPGGLAVSVIIICIVFGAMVGSSTASTVTMGLVALPAMLARGYHKSLALGCINGGGPLAMLIPPSITAIIFASVAEVSVGKLFLGGATPGLLLGSLFILYIILRSILDSKIAPSLPKEERGSWSEKFYSLSGLILPLILIISMMGTILSGIATPTEASAVGAFVSLIIAAVNKRLNWNMLKECSLTTLKVSSMIWFIIFAAHCYSSVYISIGGKHLVTDLLIGLDLPPIGILIIMQMTFFLLGFFIDPAGIIMLAGPVFLPVASELGFDPIWFGVLFIINMEMAVLTPPFGYNLFFLKSVAPPNIEMWDIYKSILPFVGIQIICLILCMIFPDIILWLPEYFIKPH